MSAAIIKIMFFLYLIICVISRPQLDTIEKALNRGSESYDETEPSSNLTNQASTNLVSESGEKYYNPCFDENGNLIVSDPDEPQTNSSCNVAPALYISSTAIQTLQGP